MWEANKSQLMTLTHLSQESGQVGPLGHSSSDKPSIWPSCQIKHLLLPRCDSVTRRWQQRRWVLFNRHRKAKCHDVCVRINTVILGSILFKLACFHRIHPVCQLKKENAAEHILSSSWLQITDARSSSSTWSLLFHSGNWACSGKVLLV